VISWVSQRLLSRVGSPRCTAYAPVVKLGDLGVAKLMKGAMTNTQIGTPHYMPPEVWPLHKREIQCVTPSLQ
jgi:serine/threonine protein kinase